MGIPTDRRPVMGPALRGAAAALLLLALVAPPAVAQRQEGQANVRTLRDGTIHVRELSNGLDVVVVQSASIPFATVEMAFRAGAFTQTSTALHGLPHLLEHMLFQQNERAFSAGVGQRINEMEAFYNGVTDEETVRYYFVVPAKHVEKAVVTMGDMVRRPNFTQRDIAAEAPIVRGELERRASNPDLLLLTVSDRQLWTDAGWERKNAGGNVLSVNDASVDRLQELHRRYYLPNNAALIVTGDVKPDEIFALAERTFGNWRSGPDPLAGLPPLRIPPLEANSREVVVAPVRDVTFLVRWHGPSVGPQRTATYAANVFAGIVNQPLSGTQRRLVESGQFELVSFSYDVKRHIGPIEIWAKTSPDRAVAAAQALGNELRRIAAPDYFGEEELVIAKKRQLVVQEMTSESASSFAHVVASLWGAADLDYYLTYQDSIDVRTAAEVREFVDTYIAGKHVTISVLLSGAAEQDIGARLRTTLNGWRVP